MAVMNSRNFIAPPALKKAEEKPEGIGGIFGFLLEGFDVETLMNENMVAIGTLSDYGKAIYTLADQKYALLKEKIEALEAMKTETNSNEPSIKSSRIGGIGMMLSISMGSRSNLIDFVTTDHEGADKLEYEARILQAECEILDKMRSLEMMAVANAAQLCHSHRMTISENFEVMVCGCSASYEESHARKFANAMRKLADRYDITLIPNDHAVAGTYADLMKELTEANVVCKTGFIPGLATETTKAIFVPKDLNAEGMYEDVHLESKGDAGTTATERKGRVQELFDQIRQAGEAYIPQAKEETAEA